MTPALAAWYMHVKAAPCLACGSRLNIEAAHIQAFPSRKVTAQMQPRSHKTEAAFACIPLCAGCHRIGRDCIHNGNEGDWLERRVAGGRAMAIGWIARELASQLEERDV